MKTSGKIIVPPYDLNFIILEETLLNDNNTKIIYKIEVTCEIDQIDFLCAKLQHLKTLKEKK